MKTWKEFRNEHLSDFSNDTIEEVRKVTSFARAFSRANEVKRLAREYLTSIGVSPIDYNIQALCALESGGTRGGGLYYPGAGTSRHSAFKELPTRQSSSGKSWTSAIKMIAESWGWGVNDDGNLCIVVHVREKDEFIPVQKISDGNECSLVAARRAMRAAAFDLWPFRIDWPEENVFEYQAADVIEAAARIIEKMKK